MQIAADLDTNRWVQETWNVVVRGMECATRSEWWQEHRNEWDDRLVERLWNALDRLMFFEVIEVPAEP